MKTTHQTPRAEAMERRLATESWRNEQAATDEVLALCYELEREAYAWRQRATWIDVNVPEAVVKGGAGL